MTNLILHGATAQPQTLLQATVFDSATGLRQNVVQMFWSMQQGLDTKGAPRYTNFPITFADALWQKGQLYLHTWGTWDWVGKVNWTSADIVAGKYDTYFHAQAALLKAWKHPCFIRLDHEMNGTWTNWFTDGPSYVALWRHIVDIIRGDGATNVAWVWCPNQLSAAGGAASTAADKVQAYYPGDAYVDWTGFDAYNFPATATARWLSFSEICSGGKTVSWLGDTYGTIAAIAPDKPMCIPEFGCHNVGGDKSAWIKDALAVIPTKYPLIRMINYYNVDLGGGFWPLLTTDGTAQAWAAGVKGGPYPLTFPMPPDLQPIKPLQGPQWGDSDDSGLAARLAAAQTTIATRDLQIATLKSGVLDLSGQLAMAAQQAGEAAEALASARTEVDRWRQAGQQVTAGLDNMRSILLP